MRVLEQCTSSTQPEVQQQINALREAFSRDTSKPFELKHTLGMHSPVMDQHIMTSAVPAQVSQQPVLNSNSAGQGWPLLNNDVSPKTANAATDYMQSFDATTASASMPGASAVAFNTNSFDLPSTTYPTQNFSHVTSTAYQQPYSLERVPSNEQQTPPVWDPSGIFSQWNTAFGPQPGAAQQTSPPATQYTPTSSASMLRQPMLQQPVSAGMQASFYQPPTAAGVRPSPQHTTMPAGAFPGMPAVTPNMWQDAFTSAYVSGHGQKRYRDESVDLTAMYDPYGAKRRG